eukprot:4607053-Pleurochrysis_carterae.AAC.1
MHTAGVFITFARIQRCGDVTPNSKLAYHFPVWFSGLRISLRIWRILLSRLRLVYLLAYLVEKIAYLVEKIVYFVGSSFIVSDAAAFATACAEGNGNASLSMQDVALHYVYYRATCLIQ